MLNKGLCIDCGRPEEWTPGPRANRRCSACHLVWVEYARAERLHDQRLRRSMGRTRYDLRREDQRRHNAPCRHRPLEHSDLGVPMTITHAGHKGAQWYRLPGVFRGSGHANRLARLVRSTTGIYATVFSAGRATWAIYTKDHELALSMWIRHRRIVMEKQRGPWRPT